ncbi:MAG TPA: peptidylprolyl isomerase [Chromatiaceae bacterium]|nr:MAG: peptidylprolyl isomerase [Thiohalocapsa sp. PB-PSB1]HBG94013.1 peptidylprolyl isomerase [Chromatiaceae bacterium]HCS91446.1 peptidylprolyl isomerase [Chromatiaceae bacterium]
MLTALIAIAPALALAQEADAGADITADAAQDISIATVNNKNYQLDLFRLFFIQRQQETKSQNTPAFQEQTFNEFLSLIVAAQEGEKRNLAENADVQTALELQRLMILSNAALQSIAKDNPPTEDELKQAYEKFKEQAQRTEYKARHILVDEQAKAEALIKQLDDSEGKNFDTLARENSSGPTAEKGGDLGWFDARNMVKPFADAVAGLEPGSYTEKPVQTQFGWHVILLEETRNAEPLSYEEAKPRLEAVVKRNKVANILNEMREEAQVELNEDIVKLKQTVPSTEPEE